MMINEQKKTERVRVLGIQVDPLRVDRAIHMTGRLLEKHKFEYIVFADTPAALANLDESYINDAALVLPGDRNIEEAAELRDWLEEDKSYQAEYFRRLFAKLNRHGASVYLAVEKEQELLKIQKILKEKYSRLMVNHVLWEAETSSDSKVNGINSYAPDVLFICGPHEKMSEFFHENRCKINAGICFCMSEIVTDADSDISDWFHGSRLKRLYSDTGKKISRFFHDFLFKKKMKQVVQEEQIEEDEGKSDEKLP